jgi:hypothetical protein
MTRAKRKADATLSRIERGRLRWLADMLEHGASLPSDDAAPVVRIELHMAADLLAEMVRVLRAAGESTAADVRGVAERVARDLMHREGLPAKQAASDTLRALHERGLDDEYPGAVFPAPTAREVLSLADELTRKRPR